MSGTQDVPTNDHQEPSLDLDDQFCFTLYAASRAVTAAYRPLLDKLGLTYPQYLVMIVLWQHGTVPVKHLVNSLNLEYGTLTPLLKRLEANSLLKRQRSAQDERIVEVAPTPQGLALREAALAIPPAIGNAMGLSEQDFATAGSILRRLTLNVGRPPAEQTDTRT
jgi:MarR family transcriptional regulator, organic hydroperoxide resistance regulator